MTTDQVAGTSNFNAIPGETIEGPYVAEFMCLKTSESGLVRGTEKSQDTSLTRRIRLGHIRMEAARTFHYLFHKRLDMNLNVGCVMKLGGVDAKWQLVHIVVRNGSRDGTAAKAAATDYECQPQDLACPMMLRLVRTESIVPRRLLAHEEA